MTDSDIHRIRQALLGGLVLAWRGHRTLHPISRIERSDDATMVAVFEDSSCVSLSVIELSEIFVVSPFSRT